MNIVLKKIADPHHVTFEQLCTALTAAEAYPLVLPVDSTSPDGMSPLTPGHFRSLTPGHFHFRSWSLAVHCVHCHQRWTLLLITSLHSWELTKWLKSMFGGPGHWLSITFIAINSGHYF